MKEFSQSEIDILNKVSFDENLIKILKTVNSTIMFAEIHPELETESSFETGEQYNNFLNKNIMGISFYCSESISYQFMNDNYNSFKKNGYIIYISEDNIGEEDNKVTILKTNDIYDSLRFEGTNGLNYDIYVEDIIVALKSIDNIFGIKLIGVEYDSLEFSITAKDIDYEKLLKELAKIYPECTNIDSKDSKEIIDEIKYTNVVYLWWE